MKNLFQEIARASRRIIRAAAAPAAAVCVCAAMVPMPASAQLTQPQAIPGIAGISTLGTNIPPVVTNTPVTSLSVIPLKYPKPGSAYTSPLPCALWIPVLGSGGPQTTNTYWFANSRDGTTNTLASSNYWWSVSVYGQGTNAVNGYAYVASSNYLGSLGFALVQTVFGGTNAMTNLTPYISWPE